MVDIMNKEEAVRRASKFLRTVYEGDITIAAEVLTAEAELLSGRDNGDTEILIEDLKHVKRNIDYLIKHLKK